MRRDMDLIRRLLLMMEAGDLPRNKGRTGPLDKWSEEEVHYHLWLLWKGGHITGASAATAGTPHWIVPGYITPEGHDLLDAMRDDRLWNRAREAIAEQGGAFTVGLLKELLIGLIRGTWGLG